MMSSSTGDDVSDLSDKDWEIVSRRFSELLPKYGSLWRSMAEQQPRMPPVVNSTGQSATEIQNNIDCSTGCCAIPSFLPYSQIDLKIDAVDNANMAANEVDAGRNHWEPDAGEEDEDDKENLEECSDGVSSSSGGSTVVRFDHVDFEPSPKADSQSQSFGVVASTEQQETQAMEVVEILSSSGSNSDDDDDHVDDRSVQLLDSPLLPNNATQANDVSTLAHCFGSTHTNPSPDILDTIIKKTKRLVILSSSDDESGESNTKSKQAPAMYKECWLVNTDDELSETGERPRAPLSSKAAPLNPLKTLTMLGEKTSTHIDTRLAARGRKLTRFKFKSLHTLSDEEQVVGSTRDRKQHSKSRYSSDEQEDFSCDESIHSDGDLSQDDSASRISGNFIASEDDYGDEEDDDDTGYEDESEALESDDSIENVPHYQNVAPLSVSKASFRRNRQTLAEQYFSEFDKKVFDDKLSEWTQVMWSPRLRTTAGCSRLRKITKHGIDVVYKATIELSTKVLDSPERLESTMLHEMCHVAAWVIDHNSKPPHGKVFKKWAKTAMKRVPRIVVTTTHDYEIEYKYAWACTAPKCGVIIQRHSRSVNVDKHVCGKCKNKLMEINVPASRSLSNKQIDFTPRKKAPPSAYNLFVKENADSVRKKLQVAAGGSHVKVSQADVMRECAKLWKTKQTS